jgi:hypothetical protein
MQQLSIQIGAGSLGLPADRTLGLLRLLVL